MDKTEKKINLSLFKTATLVVGACLLCYIAFVWNRVSDEYHTWKESLNVIAEMQYKHLSDWEYDIKYDVEKMSSDSSFNKYVNEVVSGDFRHRRKILYPLNLAKSDSQYIDFVVVDNDLNLIVETTEGRANQVRGLFNVNIEDGKFGLIHNVDSVNPTMVAYIKRVECKNDKAGYIVVLIDPCVDLFSIVNNLPITQMNISSYLCSVDGNAILDIVPYEIEYCDISQDDTTCILRGIIDVNNGNPCDDIRNYVCGGKRSIAKIMQLPLSKWLIVNKVKIEDIRNSFTNSLLLGFIIIAVIAILVLLFFIIFNDGLRRGFVHKLMRREANLRALTKELQTVLSNVNDAIITTDKNGRIWHINSIAQHLTGYSSHQSMGHNLVSIFNVSSQAGIKLDKLLDQALQSQKRIELPDNVMLMQKNGREVPISGSLSPIVNDIKITTGLVVTFRDESDNYYKERLLEQGVESYDMIFDRNPHPMCIYDVETYKIEKVNQATCDLIGYTREEMSKMTLFDFSTPQFAMLMKNTNENVRSKLLEMEEWEIIKGNGERATLAKSSFDIMLNGKRCRHILVTDMTQRRQLQHDMLGTQKRYKKMMNTLPEAVFVHGTDFKITFINQEAIRLFGATEKKQLVGKNISLLYHPDVFDSIKSNVEDMIVNQKPVPLKERKMVKLDGTVFTAEIVATPFVEGDKTFFQVLCRDVNGVAERVQPQMNDAEYRNISNVGDLQIWKIDSDNNLVYVNDSWERFVGKYGSELGKGKEWMNLIHPDDHDLKIRKWLETFEQREYFQTEWRMLGADGNYYWMLVHGAPNFDADGKFLGYFGYNININRRRIAEDEMRKSKEQAEESSKLKSTFLSTLSHEIKTPINAIVGFSDLLLSNGNAQSEKYLPLIKDNGYKLVDLIDNTVEMSKIATGQLTINYMKSNVKRIVNDAFREAKDKFNNTKGLFLLLNNNLPDTLIADIDGGKVKYVIKHLIENAMKFTESGNVTLDATVENDCVRIIVSDTGIGVDEKNIKSVFETFFKIETDDNMEIRSLGLGLAICKAYVESMHGKIMFESSLNVGTVVTVELPCIQDSIPEKQSSINYFVKSKGLVLVVDDEEFSGIYLSTMLENNGYKVIRAFDGESAVNEVKRNHDINLVLMDLQMPVMDGFEALVQIRKFDTEIPIVAQSCYSPSDYSHKLKGCDFNAVLNKPIKKDLLIETVNQFVNLKKR